MFPAPPAAEPLEFPPPPEPPATPVVLLSELPPPPPADVIHPKLEFEPEVPAAGDADEPAPPPPTTTV